MFIYEREETMDYDVAGCGRDIECRGVQGCVPNGEIVLTVNNAEKLTYSVTYRGETMIATSPMGFEFVREKPMDGGFKVM